MPFYADTTPPKQVLRSGKMTIAEVQSKFPYKPCVALTPHMYTSPHLTSQAGFVPAAIVHLSTESEVRPLLSAQCLQSAQSVLQAEVAHVRGRERLG